MSIIENFEDYSEKTNIEKYFEIANTLANINYKIKDNLLIGEFTINKKEYLIIFREYDKKISTVKFYRKNIVGDWVTEIVEKNEQNIGQSGRVLSTIKKSAIDYLKEKDVDFLLFGALDGSKGRKNLYTWFCNFITLNNPILKYKRIKYIQDTLIFIIYKHNLDVSVIDNEMMQKIQNIELNDIEWN
jgi:hypothetical protein